MTRHIVKSLTMLMLTIGLAFVSAAVASGQTGQRLSAQVPFDFIADGKTLKSGDYSVGRLSTTADTLVIRSNDSKYKVMTQTFNAGINKTRPNLEARLVFHRYGDVYFLSQIWMSGAQTGQQLHKTSQEKALERDLGIASNGYQNRPVFEVVEILATSH